MCTSHVAGTGKNDKHQGGDSVKTICEKESELPELTGNVASARVFSHVTIGGENC